MELYIADAFTDQIFGGNQAGVVLLETGKSFPEPAVMQKIAAELKHSETAFVLQGGQNRFALRYFTPEGEVDLCGHATISTFTVLRNKGKIGPGAFTAATAAGELAVTVEEALVWMQMAGGKLLKQLSPEESSEVYLAYGLGPEDRPENLAPCLVSTGLSDILLPVAGSEKLNAAVQNREAVIEISKKHDAVGVHMFCVSPASGVTAACRNFAPLYGIDEEAATGTSNGALTFYLFGKGLVEANRENRFIQGEKMGRPSVIRSRITQNGTVSVGGTAVISISGTIELSVQTN